MATSLCYGFAMSDNEREIDKPEAEIENPGSFAVRLFHARGAHPPVGLTQAQLAERAGLQQSTIAHYEAGRREPSLSNLRRLVRATGQSADYLLATRPGVDADYGALARPERQRRIDATESALRDLGVGPARSLRCAEIAEGDGSEDPALWHRACVELVRDLGSDGFCALESPCAVESFRLMLRDAAAALQRHVAQASPTRRSGGCCPRLGQAVASSILRPNALGATCSAHARGGDAP